MKKESKKQISYGTLLSYITILFNAVAGFGYTPWMIHIIGDNNYALYSMVISLINFFLMDFGLSTATERYVAKYVAEHKANKIKDLLGIVFKLYLVIMVVILAILGGVYLFIDQMYSNLGNESLIIFKRLFLIFAVYCVINFPFTPLNGILNGLEQFKITKLCDLLSRIMIIALIVVCLLLGGDVCTLVIINAIVGLLFVAIKLFLLFTKLDMKINLTYRSSELTKGVLNFSLWDTVCSIANRFAITITPQVLGMFSETNQVTIYTLSNLIESNVYLFITVLGSLFLPEVSRILTQDKAYDKLQKLAIKVGRIQAFIGYLAVIGFISIGQGFIQTWMGAGYESVYICTLLMLVPNVIIYTQTIAETALNVDNKIKYRALLCIAQAIISVVLSVLLSKIFGAIGSCIGLFCSYIVKLVGLNFFYHKFFKLNIGKFFRDTLVAMLIPMSVSLLCGIMLEHFLPNGWIWIAVKAVIITCIYVITMWIFVMKKEEKEMVTRFTKELMIKFQCLLKY